MGFLWDWRGGVIRGGGPFLDLSRESCKLELELFLTGSSYPHLPTLDFFDEQPTGWHGPLFLFSSAELLPAPNITVGLLGQRLIPGFLLFPT